MLPDLTRIDRLDLPSECLRRLAPAKITTVGKLRSKSDTQLLHVGLSPRHILMIRELVGHDPGACRLPFAKHIARFESRRAGPYGLRKRSYDAKLEQQFYGHW